MKYLLTSSPKTMATKYERLVDNKTPTKTTRMQGYGLGVTFSSRCFSWNLDFSSYLPLLQYGAPDTTR